ncbi:MAG: hypothetical protein NC548_24215 [Lachnospiraceae bacterium]|nr:hypothetical protein [Lachnospiraceae bacterium]
MKKINVIIKNTFIWHAVSYVLYAMQSAILLFIISNWSLPDDAGIFSLAFAVATLFLCVAQFGMRSYQVADIENKYNFREYEYSRLISVALCILLCGLYIFYQREISDYSNYKTFVICLVCLLKITDAAEDVFHGYYQQNDKLICAAILLTSRLFLTDVVFAVTLILFSDMLKALLCSVLFTYLFAYYSNKYTLRGFKEYKSNVISGKNILSLMYECVPVCLSQFLMMYITNASKYALDGIGTEQQQAYFGYLSMPVFSISLVSNILFTPYFLEYAKDWKEGRQKKFLLQAAGRIAMIALITCGIMVFGEWIGLDLLSLLYNAELRPYKNAFFLLLLGGGFCAVCNSLIYVITVVGYQKKIIWAYSSVAGIALICAKLVVRNWGFMGAAAFMMLLFASLAVILTIIFIYGVKKGWKP